MIMELTGLRLDKCSTIVDEKKFREALKADLKGGKRVRAAAENRKEKILKIIAG